MTNPTIAQAQEHVMNTYASFPVVFERGEGCYLYDDGGRQYLDFVAGIAVNALGYAHKEYVDRIHAQLQKLTHLSNLYYNEPAVELAEKIVTHAGMDKVFFCNSGGEAVEASLKLARAYSKQHKSDDAYKVVAMYNSFHGRTFGALSATGQTKYHKGFEPLLPHVDFAHFNDIDDLKDKIGPDTGAVILEPIQGEGGINPADAEYLRQVRQLCTENNIVLIYDEVQSGIGRTGHFFAYQGYGVTPDIVTCAKGMGGGIPVGAILAKDHIADAFVPGSHASTFGGNAVAATAALVVVEQLMQKGLLENVKKQGAYLKSKLEQLQQSHGLVLEVKGLGLMLGIKVGTAPINIVQKAMEKGLLLVPAGSDVVRFVPPLIVGEEEIDQCIEILDSVLGELQ